MPMLNLVQSRSYEVDFCRKCVLIGTFTCNLCGKRILWTPCSHKQLLWLCCRWAYYLLTQKPCELSTSTNDTIMGWLWFGTLAGFGIVTFITWIKSLKKEHSKSTDLCQTAYYPYIAQIPDLESAWWSRSPQKISQLFLVSLQSCHCRAVLKIYQNPLV